MYEGHTIELSELPKLRPVSQKNHGVNSISSGNRKQATMLHSQHYFTYTFIKPEINSRRIV